MSCIHDNMTTHTPRRGTDRGTDVTKFVPGLRASCRVKAKDTGHGQETGRQARSRRPQLLLPRRPDKPVSLSSRLASRHLERGAALP